MKTFYTTPPIPENATGYPETAPNGCIGEVALLRYGVKRLTDRSRSGREFPEGTDAHQQVPRLVLERPRDRPRDGDDAGLRQGGRDHLLGAIGRRRAPRQAGGPPSAAR